jgi:hypothetical protein
MFLELELFTLPEHLSSPSVFIGVRVTRSFDISVIQQPLVILVDKTGVPDKKHVSPYASNKCYHINKIRESTGQVFSGVRVTRSFVSCVCFVDRCLSFCIFPFGDCVVCFSFIYGF